MHDEGKVKHHYLESINRKYSLTLIMEEECQAGMGIKASNNISESVHASSTHSLKMYGAIFAWIAWQLKVKLEQTMTLVGITSL
jgi:hypothetical protein